MKVTTLMLKQWGACYWDHDGSEMAAKCEAELPATPLKIANCDWVPVEDRLWVLLRPEIIPVAPLQLLACDFAEEVLPIFEDQYPDDQRPMRAIKTSRRYLAGEVTDEELDEAIEAVWEASQFYTGSAHNVTLAAAWTAPREIGWLTVRETAWYTAQYATNAAYVRWLTSHGQLERVIAVLKELSDELPML